MSLNSDSRPGRGRSEDLWPKWMWVAVPILLVVVIAGLWWAIFSNPKTPNIPTVTPTTNLLEPHDTAQPTAFNTLPLMTNTPTRPILIEQTATPAQEIATPTAEVTAAPIGLAIGDKAKVTGTGGQGVNMRADAGTSNARVKTLSDNTVVEIIGGPTEANGFTWWQVRDPAGVSGWVVSRYLVKQ